MRTNNVELRVVVKNKAITEYAHNGQTFIEGREGSNFNITVTNHNPFRVEAVVAVDGLSVLDGKDAGPQSDGYLLGPNETIAIPGWKLNEAQVAAFEFSGKGGSYSALSTGSARNTGVIGLLVYRERYVAPNYVPRTFVSSPLGQFSTGTITATPPGWMMNNITETDLNTLIGGGAPLNYHNTVPTDARMMGALNVGAVQSAMAVNHTVASVGASVMRGAKGPQGPQGPKGDVGAQGSQGSPGVSTMEMDQSFNISRGYEGIQPQALAASVQNLGTAFGEAQTFATTTVSFARGDMQAMLVLYYDNARGLKARGIVLTRTKKDAVLATPNAFPGMSGCTPPKGWNG
jgi:hypothetical protein